MPVNYLNYHPDWKDRIRPEVLKRANYKCQFCGVPNRSEVIRDKKGEWIQVDELVRKWAKGKKAKIVRIVLTVAHLNHLVIDNREENLKALCQKCHINHDKEHKSAMNRVKFLVDPLELIDLSFEQNGEQYLPHMFTVLRAMGQQIAQIKSIKLRRAQKGGVSRYDQEIIKELERLEGHHDRLLRRCSDILSVHYKYPEPEQFYEKFKESHIKLIGSKIQNYVA